MSKTRTALIGLATGLIVLTAAAATMAQPPQGPAPGAQPGGPGPGGPGGRRGGGPGLGDPAARQQQLHDQLAITPAEETAFSAWASATQGPPSPPPRADQGLTTPQRLDRQLAALQVRVAATKTFYAALSPAQRQTFDSLPPAVTTGVPAAGRGGGGGRGGRGGGRGGPGGPPNGGPPNGGYNPQ